MKKRDYFLLLGLVFSILVCVSVKLSERTKTKVWDIDWVFFKTKPDSVNKKPTEKIQFDKDSLIELQVIDKYLNDSKSPFSNTNIPLGFIKKVRDKNAKTLIRNGNLEQVEKVSSEYQLLLEDFMQVCDSLDLPMEISKKECFQRWKSTAQYPRGKGRVWSSFFQRRLTLRRAYKEFRKQVELIFSTERVIWEQKKHFPELYQHMNSLNNLDGTPLPIYIISYPKVIAGRGQQVAGLAMFGKYKGLLTSASPEQMESYPGLIGRKNALAVHLQKGVAGTVLSHEFGHLFYLYYHWYEYLNYIQSRPGDYRRGGHGITDPSGQAAEMAENGMLPKR